MGIENICFTTASPERYTAREMQDTVKINIKKVSIIVHDKTVNTNAATAHTGYICINCRVYSSVGSEQ